jgi:GNAT superfamily N-acetyltransferase
MIETDISEAALADLLRGFMDLSLPAARWTHHAHLLVGLMLARDLPEPQLLPTLRARISAYNRASGGENTALAGYHESVTAFYAAVLAAYARATARRPLAEAAAHLLAGPLAERDVIARAYDPATLKTVQARLGYVPPDRPGFSPARLAAEAVAHPLTIRLAQPADAEVLRPMIQAAIGELLTPFLPPELVEASREVMGLDSQLVADGTYYVVEHGGLIVGCGGWSRRATLFGGDHSAGRDAALLDPARDPARVRAMYTRPGWTRRGIGRLVLETCESAARAEGFRLCELAATLGGEPLYRQCGYEAIEAFSAQTSANLRIPLLRMQKSLLSQS